MPTILQLLGLLLVLAGGVLAGLPAALVAFGCVSVFVGVAAERGGR